MGDFAAAQPMRALKVLCVALLIPTARSGEAYSSTSNEVRHQCTGPNCIVDKTTGYYDDRFTARDQGSERMINSWTSGPAFGFSSFGAVTLSSRFCIAGEESSNLEAARAFLSYQPGVVRTKHSEALFAQQCPSDLGFQRGNVYAVNLTGCDAAFGPLVVSEYPPNRWGKLRCTTSACTTGSTMGR